MSKYSKSVLMVLLLVMLLVWPLCAWAAAPAITAEAAIVIDYQSGEILYQKNCYEKRPPASLTKVMTAILAIEDQPTLDKVAIVSPGAAATEESRIHLIAGEKISLENLIYGALLKSGNDACVAIAECIANDVDDFVWRMNLKAQLLGTINTHFTNTNGLPDEAHYSCAYDLAIITRYALQNETFKKFVSTPYATIYWENGRQIKVKNTNRLLQFYPGAIGVKTGTTNAAGQCLIAAAERDGRCLITVILKSQNRFLDATNLLDYCFTFIADATEKQAG